MEIQQEKIGYKHAIILALQTLLLYLSRILTSKASNSTPEFSGPTWMKDILGYIEENFVNKISLDELSQFGNISTAHLSRVFKQMTGFNISSYIATKRVIKAKELLLRTDEKISSIAFECGFESLPHFYRTFKRIIGLTPTSFRNQTSK